MDGTPSVGGGHKPCSASLHLLFVRRRFSTIIAWPRMARIADFRLPIAPPWRADGHWKELPHRFFNRQSATKTWSSVAAEGPAVPLPTATHLQPHRGSAQPTVHSRRGDRTDPGSHAGFPLARGPVPTPCVRMTDGGCSMWAASSGLSVSDGAYNPLFALCNKADSFVTAWAGHSEESASLQPLRENGRHSAWRR